MSLFFSVILGAAEFALPDFLVLTGLAFETFPYIFFFKCCSFGSKGLLYSIRDIVAPFSGVFYYTFCFY
jgi:hypothetical protein